MFLVLLGIAFFVITLWIESWIHVKLGLTLLISKSPFSFALWFTYFFFLVAMTYIGGYLGSLIDKKRGTNW